MCNDNLMTNADEFENICVREAIADVFFQAIPDGVSASDFLFDLLSLYSESVERSRIRAEKLAKDRINNVKQ